MAKKKLPKKVGGVKLPKQLRKTGGKLIKAAASPAGRELLAAGLGMAAAAVTAMVERDREKRRSAGTPDTPDTPRKAPPRAANASGNDPHDVGVALGRMAEAALAGLFAPKRG